MNNEELKCKKCGGTQVIANFLHTEYDSNSVPTGRTRMEVDYLQCSKCGEMESVETGFMAGPWETIE